MAQNNKILLGILLLSLLGIIVSGYLTSISSTSDNNLCDISETLSCSAVKSSKYSELFGVPVALLGLVGYSVLGLICWGIYQKPFWEKRINYSLAHQFLSINSLLFFSGGAVFFSFYLSYTEFFLIEKICIFCLVSQFIILSIVSLGIWYKTLKKEVSDENNR